MAILWDILGILGIFVLENIFVKSYFHFLINTQNNTPEKYILIIMTTKEILNGNLIYSSKTSKDIDM